MISSVYGISGVGSSNAYVASKGTLNTMTLVLARALAPNVRVNAVCRGLIKTRWHTARFTGPADYEKFRGKYAESIALGKACSADDVPGVAVGLIEHGDMITGEMIKVDDGAHLGTPWRPLQGKT